MISTVSLSFDLTYTNPVTGALQPRGIVTDSTDYIGLGLDPAIGKLKGLGVINFNGDIIVNRDTIGTPMIDLENWDVNDGVPTFYFDLPLDLNGNVANGIYTFTYSLRVLADPFLGITLGGVVSAPDVLTVTSNEWLYQFLEPSNNIVLTDGVTPYPSLVSSTSYVDPDSIIVLATPPADGPYVLTFSLTNVQLSEVYSYSGCTQTTADVNFVYDCEYGDSGTWGVSNTTVLAANEVVSSLSCAINYPSWTITTPTFPGNIVVTSLPYPPSGVDTPLATGTYSVSLTQQIQQSQTDGLILLYTTSVVKEFPVSCTGSLCGLTPCIESLRVAHANELQRNRISKYQVFVDNVLLYYAEAQNYRACGETDKYRATLELIKANLDSSGCECACCDENTYYWVANNSAISVIDSLIQSFQFRLFTLPLSAAGPPPATADGAAGVQVGAIWENTTTHILYLCTANTPGNPTWVEFYNYQALVAAEDVSATGGTNLTANDVQGQLTQADALFTSINGSLTAIGVDITAIESTLTDLDGINGLTRVGNDFRLGGALDAATTIDCNAGTLSLTGAGEVLEVYSVGNQAATITVERASTSTPANNIYIETTTTSGTGADGIGSSIFMRSQNAAGSIENTSKIISTWTNATAQSSNFQITTKNAGTENVGFTLNADGSVTLNEYDGTNQVGSILYNLGVTNTGLIQKVAAPKITTYVARINQTGTADPVLTVINNDTGLTITALRSAAGNYSLSSVGYNFDALTTMVLISNGDISTVTRDPIVVARVASNRVIIKTKFAAGATLQDDVLEDACIEIRIYE